MIYRFWQLGVDIPVNERKGKAYAKAPAAVEHIDAPEDSRGEIARLGVLEVIGQALLPV